MLEGRGGGVSWRPAEKGKRDGSIGRWPVWLDGKARRWAAARFPEALRWRPWRL